MRRQHTSTPIDYSALPTDTLHELWRHAQHVINTERRRVSPEYYDTKTIDFWKLKLDAIQREIHTRHINGEPLQWTTPDTSLSLTASGMWPLPSSSLDGSPHAALAPHASPTTLPATTDKEQSSALDPIQPKEIKAGDKVLKYLD
jgi:hypothetical protein